MDKPFEIFKMGHFKIVTQLVSPMSICSNFTNRILNKINQIKKTFISRKKYVKMIMTLYAEKKIKICFSSIYNRM